MLQDPSTEPVSRVGAACGRSDDWLEVAQALAPSGFDEVKDAVCIHRHGTVLYASPVFSRMLGLDEADVLVGGTVVDWVHPRDRARLATTLEQAAHDAEAHAMTATLTAKGGRSTLCELTAIQASTAIRHVEILYFRTLRLGALSSGEDERYMATREATPAKQDTHRIGVLICDDEARLGALTAGLLAEYGFDPFTVGTGEDAITALSKPDPVIDVVLLDVNLSHGKPARDVLSTIEEAGNRVRVVLTSGLAEEDVDPKLMTHPSVSGYVAKPYGVDQLVQTIKKALGARAPSV
jgi:PAS domain S-box-containing protein